MTLASLIRPLLCAGVLLPLVVGCTSDPAGNAEDEQSPEVQAQKMEQQARKMEEQYKPKPQKKPQSKPESPAESDGSAPAESEGANAAGAEAHPAGGNGQDVTVNVNNGGFLQNAQNKMAFWKKPAPAVEVPAPELTNVNRYAQALQEKLLRRYNNTPAYAAKVAKVQLMPMHDPEVSLDGRKLRMEWSQVVFDIWGKRIPELEKEYYVVTFGDGKPLMQRTRPTITVGLNNESGYSEYSAVRGGILSTVKPKANPGMFDKPNSEKTSPLEEGVKAKDSADAPYLEYELPPIERTPAAKRSGIPVIAPAPDNLQALTVLEKGQF